MCYKQGKSEFVLDMNRESLVFESGMNTECLTLNLSSVEPNRDI